MTEPLPCVTAGCRLALLYLSADLPSVMALWTGVFEVWTQKQTRERKLKYNKKWAVYLGWKQKTKTQNQDKGDVLGVTVVRESKRKKKRERASFEICDV